jgi:hypothetical protein
LNDLFCEMTRWRRSDNAHVVLWPSRGSRSKSYDYVKQAPADAGRCEDWDADGFRVNVIVCERVVLHSFIPVMTQCKRNHAVAHASAVMGGTVAATVAQLLTLAIRHSTSAFVPECGSQATSTYASRPRSATAKLIKLPQRKQYESRPNARGITSHLKVTSMFQVGS